MTINRVLIIDVETYYGPGCTISALTTEEYVHHPDFHLIGMQVHDYFAGTTHLLATAEDVLTFFNMDMSDTMIVSHNMRFDGMVLQNHIRKDAFNSIGAFACTMSMMRTAGWAKIGGASLANLAAHLQDKGISCPSKGTEVADAFGLTRGQLISSGAFAAYMKYCANDVVICSLGFTELVKEVGWDLQWQDIVLRMYLQPQLLLDCQVLEREEERLTKLTAEVIAKAGDIMACTPDMAVLNLRSSEKFASVLKAFGVEPPTKISETTGKTTWAFAKTDEGMIALTQHEDPTIQALIAARQHSKSTIALARTQRLLHIGRNYPDLRVPLNISGAHTHRLSGCLTADTLIVCYDPVHGAAEKKITDVLPADLVWDGQEFVEHGGVVYQGEQEVEEWAGITGTLDHPVFTREDEDEPIALADAKSRGAQPLVGGAPQGWRFDSGRLVKEGA